MSNFPVISEHEGFLVVRDDLIAGGTKTRALPVLIGNAAEYVYASPVCGYAQVALAVIARQMSKRATVFCAGRQERHSLTLEAERNGARICEVSPGYMTVVRARAKQYCLETGAVLLPFGLDDESFIRALADVARGLPVKPSEVWCATGSGVLIRALQLAWPEAQFHGVRVGAEPDAGSATIYQAREKFDNPAKTRPPFPSCVNYDAKVWQIMKAHAKPGALFWNVAA